MSNKANNTKVMYTAEQVKAMMEEHDKQTRVEMEQAQKSKEEEALKMAEEMAKKNEESNRDSDYEYVKTFLKKGEKMRKKGNPMEPPTNEQYANYSEVSKEKEAAKKTLIKKIAIATGIVGVTGTGVVILTRNDATGFIET